MTIVVNYILALSDSTCIPADECPWRELFRGVVVWLYPDCLISEIIRLLLKVIEI